MCKITVRPAGSSLAAQQYAAQQLALQQMQIYQQQQAAAAAAAANVNVNPTLVVVANNATPLLNAPTPIVAKSNILQQQQNNYHHHNNNNYNNTNNNDFNNNKSFQSKDEIREIVQPLIRKEGEMIENIVRPPSSHSHPPAAAPPPPTTTIEKEKRPVAPSSNNNTEEAAAASLRAIISMCMPNKPPVRFGALIRESLLGQVRLGDYTLPSGEIIPIVIKEFNMNQVLSKTSKHGKQLYEDALAELQIHAYISKQKSQHAIGLYGLYHDSAENKLYAYMEYAAKGELFSLLQHSHNEIPFNQAAHYFVQLMKGVNDLHSINVVHRDLSLENVLLSVDNEVKICDFGLSTICPPNHVINDGLAIGKLKYMSPELFYREEYDPRLCDIWSSGVILFILLTGVFPYELPSADDPRLVLVCTGQINELLAHWKRSPLDAEALDMFSHIFCPPDQRWNAQQLLNHPFCQRYANVNTSTFINPSVSSSSLLSLSTSTVSTPCSSTSTITSPSTIVRTDTSLSSSSSCISSPHNNTPSPFHYHDTSPDTSSPISSHHVSTISDNEICELTTMMDHNKLHYHHQQQQQQQHHNAALIDQHQHNNNNIHHRLFSLAPETPLIQKFDQQMIYHYPVINNDHTSNNNNNYIHYIHHHHDNNAHDYQGNQMSFA